MSKSESNNSVAYLGPLGTYTHTALLKYFGSTQACEAKTDILDVFASVETGDNRFGIVPVENSTEGSINQTLDCISGSSVRVYGEVLLRIHHCLIADSATSQAAIKKIVSHQQSLGQCREWLAKHLPAVELVAVSSNAEAARIAKNEIGVAAIAGKIAADLYGLDVLAENIEDTIDNTTRFWVLAQNQKQDFSSNGGAKTSIIISTNNAPGTLFKALEPFHRFDVNLSKLESRPSRKTAWSYSFYVDFDGHIDEPKVQSALAVLKQHSLEVKILGSYPSGN